MIHAYGFYVINPSASSSEGKACYPPHTSGQQEATWLGWAGWSLVSAEERRRRLQQPLASWPLSRWLLHADPGKVTREKLKWTRPSTSRNSCLKLGGQGWRPHQGPASLGRTGLEGTEAIIARTSPISHCQLLHFAKKLSLEENAEQPNPKVHSLVIQ